MRLSGERDPRRGPAAEAASSKSFAVRFASIVLAAILTASFMPVAAFADDLPPGNIKVTEYINMKLGEQFELDGWDYASQYEDDEFHSPQIVFGGGDVADISVDPSPGKCKVLAKKTGINYRNSKI